MRDINTELDLDNADRIASGSVKVTDYTKFVGVKASGSIEVLDWEALVGVKAELDITITGFAALALKTITVNGEALVEGTNWNRGASNDAAAIALAAAIDALDDVAAAAVGPVVTITASAFGRDGNLIGVSTNAASGITIPEAHLLGGLEHATITVGAVELVQGTDFTAETSDAVTAENIKVAIHALPLVNATRANETVTIEAASVGVAGNLALSATWDNMNVSALTLSGETLTGGVDNGTFTFGDTVLAEGAGNDFTAETSNAVTATNLAAAIDNIAGFAATVDGGDNTLINIVADAAGESGNVAMTTNAPDAVVITDMSGGADYFYSDILEYDAVDNSSITITPEITALAGNVYATGIVTVVTYGDLTGKTLTVGETVLTEGADWTAETSNDVTAQNIADAINALDNVTAAVVENVVTITSVTAGTPGNAIVLATNGAEDMTVSGAGFLTGGLNPKVNFLVDVSYDKSDWEEIYKFDTLSAIGSKRTATLTEIQNFARVRIEVLYGTASVQIHGIASQFGGDAEQTSIMVSGEFTIPSDGEEVPAADLPAALSTDSVNFKYIDIQAPEANTGDVQVGEITFTPGMSKRYTRGNLKDISVTDGAIGDKLVWDGEQV